MLQEINRYKCRRDWRSAQPFVTDEK